jgi:hypothetical protein
MVNEPPIGAHLTTPRWGYVHHGIYAGGGRVVHYAGLNRFLRRGPVEETSIERFARGRPIAIKDPVSARYGAAERVARARSRVGENRYHLLSNNCEHFASWCISGTGRSMQVDVWMRRLGVGVAQRGQTWITARRLFA